jgi:D-sedoheptulose 7-phosphate isomerase
MQRQSEAEMDIKRFVKHYTKSLSDLLESIDENIIHDIVDTFEQTVKDKSRIYMIGNGGSAATAAHYANDFAIGLKRREIITFDMVSLADNAAVCTAIANDVGYENIFYMQLKDILRPEDVVFAISCSGNSPNIVKAVEYAKTIGAKVIGCSGFSGGKLYEMSDIRFHIETASGEYGLVEDIHMILDHVIYSYYIQRDKC